MARPTNIVFMTGEAQPLHLSADDRRFWPVDLPVPAPASWQRGAPTDMPVLRNDLWDAMRSIARGTWTVAVYGSGSAPRVLAMQDYVVDDHGNLAELTAAACVQNNDWYASTYTIDPAACEWMDQFTAPTAPGSALRSMATAARQAAAPQPAPTPAPAQAVVDDVCATVLPEPYYAGHAATVLVADDPHWRSREPLYSVLLEHDDDRLVLTKRQLKALAVVLATLVLTACGGGDPEPELPDVATPRVVCPSIDPTRCQ